MLIRNIVFCVNVFSMGRLIYVMVNFCVVFEVRIEFLNKMQTSFNLKGLRRPDGLRLSNM